MRGSTVWPDPNSPAFASITFGVAVSDLLVWLAVRDALLGQNSTKRDVSKALALARDCCHPDAVWLTAICRDKNVASPANAKEVFSHHLNDARALCFYWFHVDQPWSDLTLLRQSAALGYAFACAVLSRTVRDEDGQQAFNLARQAAAQQERDGFYALGYCFEHQYGCEQDMNLAKKNFLIAADLGDVSAAMELSDFFEPSDSARWLWLGRAASRGCTTAFLDSFSIQVRKLISGSNNATAVFAIGRALKEHINVEEKEIFGTENNFENLVGAAIQAVSFYDYQVKCTRFALDAWILIAIRLKIMKDIRKLICKLIWQSRFEASYKVDFI